MRALVTGGAGFIGSHLVDSLTAGGHNVVVLDNLRWGNKLDPITEAQVELLVGDVRDAPTVRRAVTGCDVVFHFAAMIGVDIVAADPLETMRTEYEGLVNVAEAGMAAGVSKIVYASTSGVYGRAPGAGRETSMPAPSSCYAVAKRFNEVYLGALYKHCSLHSILVRPFNVYGPRQDHRMVIPRFFEQALRGDPLTIFGSGRQTRDFTYIDDVVHCILRLTEVVSGCEAFNIAQGEEWTIGELARMIVAITGSRSEIRYANTPDGRAEFEVARRRGSVDKLRHSIGFVPQTRLEAGLRKTAKYWLPMDSYNTLCAAEPEPVLPSSQERIGRSR
jgi:nucleoside-diphosphate-sugar epimerase